MRPRTTLAIVATLAVLAGACSDDGDSASTTSATAPSTSSATSTAPTGGGDLAVAAGQPFPAARCEANRAAGTITYLSGFDFAAAASIVDVIVADQAGYYEELCLDVELVPSVTTDNYPVLAAGDAQFASGGSFSEVVSYADANDADLVAVAVEGRAAIDSLILHPEAGTELEDLAGSTIGVKFALPPSIAAMLATAGLVEGTDYETVLLDGFDPLAHFALEGIAGFPGYKSNEPGALERAGLEFELLDPTEFDVPGSFGVIVANGAFVDEHPTAAQDFVRATMRGLADAVADPAAASAAAVELVVAGGNPNFLSPEGEAFRWETDAGLVVEQTPEGSALGVPDVAGLQAEVEAYAAVGLFGGTPPDITERVDTELIEGVYDDAGEVIWPSA